MKKYKYVCSYINSRGNTQVRYFKQMDEGLNFCDMLDERISRGTCKGYIFTTI